MKLSKKFKAIFASAVLFGVSLTPLLSLNSTQVNADTAYDFPEGTIFQTKGTVTVWGDNNEGNTFIYVFNGNGDPKLSNRQLAYGSAWYTDEYRIYKDEKYYRVSTNEWVKNEYISYNRIDQ